MKNVANASRPINTHSVMNASRAFPLFSILFSHVPLVLSLFPVFSIIFMTFSLPVALLLCLSRSFSIFEPTRICTRPCEPVAKHENARDLRFGVFTPSFPRRLFHLPSPVLKQSPARRLVLFVWGVPCFRDFFNLCVSCFGSRPAN